MWTIFVIYNNKYWPLSLIKLVQQYFMKHSKFVSVFLIAILIASSGCFSQNNEDLEFAFDFVPGEIFVRLATGFERSDLEKITNDFDVTIDRELGTGYIILVPEDFEPLWITQFSSVPIIVESTYNRFGHEYSISVEDPAPIVENDQLTITVNYTGCEGGHVFTLERPGAFSNNMNIWLFKSTPDEDCEAVITDEFTFNLERFILLSSRVTIEDPFGNQVLLWPEPEEPVAD